MAGLLGALAMGAVGGAGKGMSENAKSEMAFNYDQMREQMRAEMEQRIYERGRADKATDYAQQRTDKLADDEKAHERAKGLIRERDKADKDPLGQEEKWQKVTAKKYEGVAPEEIRQMLDEAKKQANDLIMSPTYGKDGGKAGAAMRERIKELEFAYNSQRNAAAPIRTTVEEVDPVSQEASTKTTVKQKTFGEQGGQTGQRVIDWTEL